MNSGNSKVHDEAKMSKLMCLWNRKEQRMMQVTTVILHYAEELFMGLITAGHFKTNSIS